MSEIFRPASEVKSGFASYSAQFDELLVSDVSVAQLWTGGAWTEGPTYLAEGDCVLFSDIPGDRIMRYNCQTGAVDVFAHPAGYTNGNTVDLDGRLLSCEHGNRRVVRREPNGSQTIIADNYQGKKLNSPNDIVVKSDGTIWFTDPPYGIIDETQGYLAQAELPQCYLFKFDPASGELEIASDELDRPNGLAFSPNEDVLYVTDTGKPANILAFSVSGDNKLSAPREFARPRPGKPDGMRVAQNGYIFSSAWDGIQVFAPDGELLGRILVPEQRTSNCHFGGSAKKTLYITATHSLYKIHLNIAGAR